MRLNSFEFKREELGVAGIIFLYKTRNSIHSIRGVFVRIEPGLLLIPHSDFYVL